MESIKRAFEAVKSAWEWTAGKVSLYPQTFLILWVASLAAAMIFV